MRFWERACWFWRHWRDYIGNELLAKGMISETDMSLFKVTDDIETAVEEITGFYRRFHSMRWVGDVLVLRLNSALSAAGVGRLNRSHGGILAGGTIEQNPGPIEGEAGEHPELPRLALRFNRLSFGRLRQLIDDLNGIE